MTGAPVALSRVAWRFPQATRWFGAAHGVLLRCTRGWAGSSWFGASVMVLETVGRRSGAQRMAPVVYVPDGDDLVIVPANAGSAVPAWWLNLQAASHGIAHLGTESRPVRAREAHGPQRERLWRRHAAVTPVAHYQRLSGHRLPVVLLERVSEESGAYR